MPPAHRIVASDKLVKVIEDNTTSTGQTAGSATDATGTTDTTGAIGDPTLDDALDDSLDLINN